MFWVNRPTFDLKMSTEERLSFFLSDLEKALNSLREIVEVDLSEYDLKEQDWIKNGQIQKFEIAMELTWKTIRFFLLQEEYEVPDSPKKILKCFASEGFISEMQFNLLFEALENRNLLSHIYKLELFESAFEKLPDYQKAMSDVFNRIRDRRLS